MTSAGWGKVRVQFIRHFAAAFALYAFLRGMVGSAGAAAILAGAAALVLLLAGLVAAFKAGVGKRPATLAERAAEFVREKPLAAVAAALAAGFFAVKNPQTLATILKELLDPKSGRKR